MTLPRSKTASILQPFAAMPGRSQSSACKRDPFPKFFFFFFCGFRLQGSPPDGSTRTRAQIRAVTKGDDKGKQSKKGGLGEVDFGKREERVQLPRRLPFSEQERQEAARADALNLTAPPTCRRRLRLVQGPGRWGRKSAGPRRRRRACLISNNVHL